MYNSILCQRLIEAANLFSVFYTHQNRETEVYSACPMKTATRCPKVISEWAMLHRWRNSLTGATNNRSARRHQCACLSNIQFVGPTP